MCCNNPLCSAACSFSWGCIDADRFIQRIPHRKSFLMVSGNQHQQASLFVVLRVCPIYDSFNSNKNVFCRCIQYFVIDHLITLTSSTWSQPEISSGAPKKPCVVATIRKLRLSCISTFLNLLLTTTHAQGYSIWDNGWLFESIIRCTCRVFTLQSLITWSWKWKAWSLNSPIRRR